MLEVDPVRVNALEVRAYWGFRPPGTPAPVMRLASIRQSAILLMISLIIS